MKKHAQYDDDDGRTIANMNVDGMPWYVARKGPEQPASQPDQEPLKLTVAERWAMLSGMLGASLLIALIFVVAAALFILFLEFIWSRG